MLIAKSGLSSMSSIAFYTGYIISSSAKSSKISIIMRMFVELALYYRQSRLALTITL